MNKNNKYKYHEKHYKDHYKRNLIISLLIIITIYLFGLFYYNKIIEVISRLPILKEVYALVINEFNNRSIIGLSLVTFLGSLFFLGFPGELIFLIYSRIGYSTLLIFFIMLIFIMAAQIINYFIGSLIERKWLDYYIKYNKKHYQMSLKDYGVYFILIFNILPLPADLLTVYLGIIKYDFKKAMLWTFLGKIVKFLFLILLIYFFNVF